MDTYIDFLQSKIPTVAPSGFEITDADVHPSLKPHQRDAVKWAVAGGRRALFESFGLGKTVQELEYCRIITDKLGGQALIVLPLGVMQEFRRDAAQLLDMAPEAYVTIPSYRVRRCPEFVRDEVRIYANRVD